MPNIEKPRVSQHNEEFIINGNFNANCLMIGGSSGYQLDKRFGPTNDISIEGVREE
jgi:hypothetical protein